MKARTIIIYQGRQYNSEVCEITQSGLDSIEALYDDQINELSHLSFPNGNGVWYCFPRRVLDESILCVEVVEDENTALEPPR